jgi:NAD(P)-dependent dehydrogenase (short-subunit alcohol dehydrogenase family)
VTGGSAGIGRATVARLAASGALVVTCARDGERLAEAVSGLPGVTGIAADVADSADRARLVAAVVQQHGRLDAVVLNAGLGWAGLLEDTPGEAVVGMVALNLTGAVEVTRLALPHLLASARERGQAHIVAVSSAAAWAPVPPLTVYSATKAGLQGFAAGLRREVTSRGIRVHTVNPGFVATEWLVRGRGSPPASDADVPGRLAPGIAPERVAEQIARSLSASRSRTVAVPRWFGLARLGGVPPLDRLLDALLSRQAPRIRRAVEGMVDRRVPRRDPTDTETGDRRSD